MKKLLALMALYNILFGTSINMIILPIIDPLFLSIYDAAV